ncbi:MAG: 9-O-acetylesterase [Lentisphaeria bacterium]|nr:9-O-acetylesterase [Lentisphaeria bacterium]
MKKIQTFVLAIALVLLGADLIGNVVPASIFCDKAVLQRNMQVPVWGTADAGETVRIAFAGQTLETTADANGKWMVRLAPMDANATPQDMTINDIVVHDILIGQVWLCSGQSNMEMPLWTDNPAWRNYDGDKLAAEFGDNAMIRVSRMDPHVWAKLPNTNFKMSWNTLTPDLAKQMSAVAFFFGVRLQKMLGVPIGLVASHWSGTRIEPWTPPCGFDSVPEVADIARSVNAKLPGHPVYYEINAKMVADYAAWLANTSKSVMGKEEILPPPEFPQELQPWSSPQHPTVLYNQMLVPFVPFAFKGAIWYQGCSNVDDGMLYKHKMQALFNGWKQIFQNPELKFYFVQLAPYRYGGDTERLPKLWEAQEAFAKENEPQVGMAVINDHGNFGDIHPHDKQPVGERLANLTLKRDYGFKDLKPEFPRCVSHAIDGNAYVLKFENVESWKTTNDAPIQDFQIAGIDGAFKPANVTVKGTDLIVTSPEVSNPKAVRYLWNETVEGKLFNEESLPLGAFRFCEEITPEMVLDELGEGWQQVYQFDLFKGLSNGLPNYTVNNAASISGKIKRIAYYVTATLKNGNKRFIGAAMDAFTDDPTKIGIPTYKSGIFFQTKVANLDILTNVAGIANGRFPEGNIEFWPNNYMTENATNLPDANTNLYDFDDTPGQELNSYGCMQLHLFPQKITLFAYNAFNNGLNADFGIGNCSGQHPDYTFAYNLSKDYSAAAIAVYVIAE